MPVIPFGGLLPRRRDRLRGDPVGAEQLGETVLSEGLASGKLGPRLLRVVDQPCDDGRRGQAMRSGSASNSALMSARRRTPSVRLSALPSILTAAALALSPQSAPARSAIANWKLPVVGAPVLQFLRHRRFRVAQGVLRYRCAQRRRRRRRSASSLSS